MSTKKIAAAAIAMGVFVGLAGCAGGEYVITDGAQPTGGDQTMNEACKRLFENAQAQSDPGELTTAEEFNEAYAAALEGVTNPHLLEIYEGIVELGSQERFGDGLTDEEQARYEKLTNDLVSVCGPALKEMAEDS